MRSDWVAYNARPINSMGMIQTSTHKLHVPYPCSDCGDTWSPGNLDGGGRYHNPGDETNKWYCAACWVKHG